MKRKLQVFVSSTYMDLKVERQAAVEAILKAGHIPAGMELFTAGNLSQWKTIQRWIDESDVYMLILGGRYGSIEPETGLSYTELEYNYAEDRAKPLFSVVITKEHLEETVKSKGVDAIEQINASALNAFRNRVLSKTSSFFSDLKDIKLSIHESMAEHVANTELIGWISGDDVADEKALNAEIKRLREENGTLQESLRKSLSAKESTEKPNGDQEPELVTVFKNIPITMPAILTSTGKPWQSNLFEIAYDAKEALTVGYSNTMGMDDSAQFYYFKILPRLQAYGLAENEAVPGVKYRRSFLNKAGQKFFSSYEAAEVLKSIKG